MDFFLTNTLIFLGNNKYVLILLIMPEERSDERRDQHKVAVLTGLTGLSQLVNPNNVTR